MQANQMITGNVKAVGKYKDKFNSTGLLVQSANGEVWVDVPGQLNWKDYKDKNISISASQNDKGYWSGTISGQSNQQPVPQTTHNTPQAKQDAPDWDKIAEGKVMCALITAAIQSKQMQCADLNDVKVYTDVIMGKTPIGQTIADLREGPF